MHFDSDQVTKDYLIVPAAHTYSVNLCLQAHGFQDSIRSSIVTPPSSPPPVDHVLCLLM